MTIKYENTKLIVDKNLPSYCVKILETKDLEKNTFKNVVYITRYTRRNNAYEGCAIIYDW